MTKVVNIGLLRATNRRWDFSDLTEVGSTVGYEDVTAQNIGPVVSRFNKSNPDKRLTVLKVTALVAEKIKGTPLEGSITLVQRVR